MPDTISICGLPFGQAAFTVTCVAGDTVTIPGAKKFVYGPPVNGDPTMEGHFELQGQSTDTGETANTYRWVADVPFGTAAPTAFSYVGDDFVPLGGI